jgi:hypothetical protein
MNIFKVIRLKNNYKVVKSNEPEDDKTHILVWESQTKHGCGYQRVFKGTYKQCKEEKVRRVEERMRTQKNEILDYLQKHGTITTLESQMNLYITDPQHYIMELRKEGYLIKDRWIHKVNRNGRKIKYKEYRLETE